MGKIFCLMGKSASGKDTVYKNILSDKELNLKKIIPYTTRPLREREKDGVQYYFTDEKSLEKLEKDGKVIECRSYDTVYGIWKYFTVADNQIDLERNSYIIIGTPEAFVKLKNYFGSERILPIYIELDDGVRLSRALSRERKQSNPKYEEMCRRFLADSADFSEENLKNAGIDNRFPNNDLNECVENIKFFIKNELSIENRLF